MHSITCYEAAYRMRRQNISINQIAATLGYNRATIYRWLKGIKQSGIQKFLRDKKAKRHRRPQSRTPEYIAQKVVDIRNQWGYCGFKIQKELQEIHGVRLSLATIYRILHERFTRRAVGVKQYQKHQPIVKSFKPREVVEHDTVDLGGNRYAYTSIDVFTKEPCVVIATDLTMQTGTQAFLQQKAFYGPVATHQSDNGSEFQSDFVKAVLASEGLDGEKSRHRYSRPYKKNEQSHIENFNRSLRSECFPGADYGNLSIAELQRMANDYTEWFITRRWHMGLPQCMTPLQFQDHYQKDPERALMELTTLQAKRYGKRKCRNDG